MSLLRIGQIFSTFSLLLSPACDDNCTGILLDTVETLSAKLAAGTSHIVDGIVLPPWEDLTYIDANATECLGELELRDRLRQRMKSVPWHKHRQLMTDVEAMLKNVNNCEIVRYNVRIFFHFVR